MSVAGGWTGLQLGVDGPARPGLRVEVTGGRRLLLRQGDEVVLLGEQRAGHRGVHYLRTNRFRSPVPPITAAQARRLRSPDDAWAARWTHRFADWLRATEAGPLHAGSWTLSWGMPSWSVAAHWPRLPVVVLAPAPDPAWVTAAQDDLLRDSRGPGPRFAGDLDGIARREGRTRAWRLPGGPAAWAQAAQPTQARKRS